MTTFYACVHTSEQPNKTRIDQGWPCKSTVYTHPQLVRKARKMDDYKMNDKIKRSPPPERIVFCEGDILSFFYDPAIFFDHGIKYCRSGNLYFMLIMIIS
jgi:hypothetical protein